MPIVIPAMGDPIASGLTKSMSRPDGNVTGVSVFATELSRKRLELFKEALPGLQRVGVLSNALRPAPPAGVAATEQAAAALGIQVIDMKLPMPDGIAPAFSAAVAQGAQGVVVVSDTATISHHEPLCDAGLAHRLPMIFANRTYLRAGGLMSYGPDLEGASHRAAHFVDRILKGARPADLPIEQPQNVQLIVNLKTARARNISVPQSIQARIDGVLE